MTRSRTSETGPRPTWTPWRLLWLLLVGPLTFVAVALVVYFGPDAWTLGVQIAPCPAAPGAVVGCWTR